MSGEKPRFGSFTVLEDGTRVRVTPIGFSLFPAYRLGSSPRFPRFLCWFPRSLVPCLRFHGRSYSVPVRSVSKVPAPDFLLGAGDAVQPLQVLSDGPPSRPWSVYRGADEKVAERVWYALGSIPERCSRCGGVHGESAAVAAVVFGCSRCEADELAARWGERLRLTGRPLAAQAVLEFVLPWFRRPASRDPRERGFEAPAVFVDRMVSLSRAAAVRWEQIARFDLLWLVDQRFVSAACRRMFADGLTDVPGFRVPERGFVREFAVSPALRRGAAA